MRDLTNYLHIPYLIVKDLHGELSDKERLTLEQWLDEREDNKLGNYIHPYSHSK